MCMIRVIIQDRFCFLKEGIMDRKYNAFISYRHAPEDIKIASEVQTQLERFKIPAEIQKKTGVKRFERIFRDKEELPITSDLNEDIDLALRNSDHLIVICSVRTGESIWVQKEIESFLKYHGKKNIFTVLVDGEPGDVIPDILLHDTVTRRLADGREETREEIIEPLSCDYRIGIKKARKTELPRLAASMLGVAYDELVQRRRQYQRRRNAMIGGAAAVGAAAAIGYLSWSLFQIGKNYDLAQFNYQLAQENYALAQANYQTAQENYMESLKNQSRFLATESGRLLDEDDKVGAVQLALAALPDENEDRPVIIEAEHALANALGSYVTPGCNLIDFGWKYDVGFKIQEFKISEEDKHLVVIDVEGNVTAWDLDTHNIIRTFDPGANDIILTQDGNLYICYPRRIVRYDSDFETVIWDITLDEDHKTDREDGAIKLPPNGDELFLTCVDSFAIIDSNSGKVVEDHYLKDEIQLDDLDSLGSIGLNKINVSPDRRYIIAEFLVNYRTRSIYVLDREAGTWKLLQDGMDYIQATRFTADGKLVVCYSDDNRPSSFAIGESQSIIEGVGCVSMHDLDSAETLWTAEIPYSLVGYDTEFAFCNYVYDINMDPAETVAVMYSNKCAFIEKYTGTLLGVRELPSEFINSYMTASEKGLILILRGGEYVYLSLTDPDSYLTVDPYFMSGVVGTTAYASDVWRNVFLVEYDKSIIEYITGYYDRSAVFMEGAPERVDIRYSYMAGDKILIVDDDGILYCLDMNDGSLMWKTDIGMVSYAGFGFVTESSDGDVYFTNYTSGDDWVSSKKLCRVSIDDGTVEYVCDISNYSGTDIDVADGVIWWPGASYDQCLNYFDISSGETGSVTLKNVDDYVGTMDIDVSPDGKRALLTIKNAYDGSYYILADVETGDNVISYCDNIEYSLWAPESDRFIVGSVFKSDIYDSNGKFCYSLGDGSMEILEPSFSDRGIVVVYKTGRVVLYDNDGVVINSTDITFSRSADPGSTYFTYYGDDLIIDVFTDSIVIDMNEFAKRAEMRGLLGYYEEGSRYILEASSSSGMPVVVMFDKKTVDDLIREGREFLGDTVMSEEMRTRYGID